jgi:hypothetical protein
MGEKVYQVQNLGVAYIDTNMPFNQGSPLKPHCTLKTGKLEVTLGAFLDILGAVD